MGRDVIHCKHFRSILDNDTCEAGISYESLRHIDYRKRPCFCRDGQAPNPGCDKAEFPTAEEIAAEDAELEKLFERSMTARQAIVDHLGPWKRGKTDGGYIQCPICTHGKLNFSRAGLNGHIHAACTTADCVSWME